MGLTNKVISIKINPNRSKPCSAELPVFANKDVQGVLVEHWTLAAKNNLTLAIIQSPIIILSLVIAVKISQESLPRMIQILCDVADCTPYQLR